MPCAPSGLPAPAKSSNITGCHTNRTMRGTCCRLAVCAPSSTPQGPRVNTIQASRQHPAKCTVLWQISLMYLKLQADRNGAGTATGSLRPLGDGAAELNGVGADEKGSRAQLGPFRSQQSLANGAGQGAPVATGPHKQTTLAQR